MKKSKLVLLLLLAALGGACAASFGPVTIPYRAKGIVDFNAYKDLFFIDFICDVPAADFDAGAEVRRVFVEEIPFASGKKVALLEPEHWATVRGLLQRYRLAVDVQYENSVFFRNVFQAHPRALVLRRPAEAGHQEDGRGQGDPRRGGRQEERLRDDGDVGDGDEGRAASTATTPRSSGGRPTPRRASPCPASRRASPSTACSPSWRPSSPPPCSPARCSRNGSFWINRTVP